MAFINRSLMFVTPTEAFHEWLRSLDPNHDGKVDEPVGYLIPPIDDEDAREKILRQVWPGVFDRELAWWVDETQWPAHRSLADFRRYFNVAFCTILDDLCGWDIEPEST